MKHAWSGVCTSLLLVAGCESPERESPAVGEFREAAIFVEQAAETGLDFVHFNGMTGEHFFNEMMGGGAALFDYDNDGDLDLYLVQGHLLGSDKTLKDASFQPEHPLPLTDRLYRNDLALDSDETPVLRFTDVTARSSIESYGYGMGVAAADYDNDGWTDLYVTNYGGNQLLRNNGDGTFSDLTETSRTDDSRWSVPAVFFDYDRDSWLDLYVGNYVEFSLASARTCRSETGSQVYCSPLAYRPQADRLLHNRGASASGMVRFEDVSRLIDPETEIGATLGVAAADFNTDSLPDLYVANDGLPNHLWINQGQKRGETTFRNEAVLAGAAVNERGEAEASMGLDVADFDGDGDEDLLVTHLSRETNTVYVNNGEGLFEDASFTSGLGEASWEFTGFGTSWMDYDNDGWLDIFVANGAVVDLEHQVRVGDPYPLHQTNQLFRNLGQGRFEEVTDHAGAAFDLSEVSRGAAFGDIDNDGDIDIVVANNNGPVRLLINQIGSDASWIGLRLLGGARPRDMLGARAKISPSRKPPLWRRARSEGSYASARDPRILAGLGGETEAEKVQIYWPDGRISVRHSLPANRHYILRQREDSGHRGANVRRGG
ncbi:MAG: CRTAC1 family protein [bacterium]|nr:CRTAC1 family protein [bacterium]